MKRFVFSTILMSVLAGGLSAQTARVQVIHNSPDPAAARVDVYLNGSLLLDNFKFRAATPFIDAPAEELISIAIAPNTSESVEDALATFEYTLAAGETYVIVASGVLNPDSFGDNPDALATNFDLAVFAGAREASTTPGNIDFIFFHGSTDAPTVDAIARDVATVVDDASFRDFQGYVSVPASKYLLDVTPGSDESTIVTTARAYLQDAGGAAAVVFASGFLSTDDEPAGARSFKLLAALPDGTVRVLPLLSTALIQVIHNAADPAAAEVDVYLNGDLAIDNFEFRSATGYLEVPANQEISIAIAGGASASVADALATFPATLKAGAAYTIIANGVLNPDDFTANPDGADIGFTLWVREGAIVNSGSGSDVSFIGVHGSTDAPTVDIIARDVATLLDNVSYGAVSDYITVGADSYILDVALGDAPEVVVASYTADLSGLGGGTAVVFASGFLAPGDGPVGSEGFGLYATLADGTTFALPVYTDLTEGGLEARVGNFSNEVFPNPANGQLNVRFDAAFNGMINLISLDGRTLVSQNFASEFASVATLNVDNVPAGMYILSLNNGSAIQTYSVSVQ